MMHFNVSELTLDNIGKWPAPVKIAVAALAALFVFTVCYFALIKPNIEQYNMLVAQEETLKQQFEEKQQLAANVEGYKSQLNMMEERFGNMLKQLPAQNEMPGLLEDISKTGVASGLRFELFAPMPEVLHDFYVELPINITVVGTYHELAVFLSRIAQMSRIVTLHDFEITSKMDDKTPDSRQKNDNKDDLLTMKIMAKIYRYRA